MAGLRLISWRTAQGVLDGPIGPAVRQELGTRLEQGAEVRLEGRTGGGEKKQYEQRRH